MRHISDDTDSYRTPLLPCFVFIPCNKPGPISVHVFTGLTDLFVDIVLAKGQCKNAEVFFVGGQLPPLAEWRACPEVDNLKSVILAISEGYTIMK